MDLGLALGGAIFTESIFNLPGIGRVVINSVDKLDLPVIVGTVVFATIVIIIFTFLVDVLYGIVDPRIRFT
jgi:peptide/nickel transport system permease protein